MIITLSLVKFAQRLCKPIIMEPNQSISVGFQTFTIEPARKALSVLHTTMKLFEEFIKFCDASQVRKYSITGASCAGSQNVI